MIKFFLIISLFLSSLSYSQSITRQVIASTGSLGTAGISSSTTGPSVLFTSNSVDTVHLTQGFQQPTAESLIVEFIITPPSCLNYSGGSIEAIIEGCSGNYSITWSTGADEVLIEDLGPGTYGVEISSGACQFSDEVTITLEENCDDNIPNLLTINGDGANDTWVIPMLFFSQNAGNRVNIFNRWGQLVWDREFYNNTSIIWDGLNNSGNELSSGTYFYEIILPNKPSLHGYVELLR